MLAGTLSEGAHYLIDTIAGSGMALFGYAVAWPILRAEDNRRRPAPAQAVPAYAPASS
jgi:hypothetical protein